MHGVDIVLASGSPRRRELLNGLGWQFRVVVPAVDEYRKDGEAPDDLCMRLSCDKARMVAAANSDSLVIAADTIVTVGGQILGKPTDKCDSLRMLASLAGKTHEVLTGLTVCYKKAVISVVESTGVHFRDLTEAEIAAYVETGEGMDKAGAYAIQGKGALLISRIEGDYFNVVGLPLCRLAFVLNIVGVTLMEQLSD